jgi:hypothetical protein
MFDKMLKIISCAVLLCGIKAFSQTWTFSGPLVEERQTLSSTGSTVDSFESNRIPSPNGYITETDLAFAFMQQNLPYSTSITSVFYAKPKTVAIYCDCVIYFDSEGNSRLIGASTPVTLYAFSGISIHTIDFTMKGLALDQNVEPRSMLPILNHLELARVQSEISFLIDPGTLDIIPQSTFIHFDTIPSSDFRLHSNSASLFCSYSATAPAALLVRVVSPNRLKTQSPPRLVQNSSPLNGRTRRFAFTGCIWRACSMKG